MREIKFRTWDKLNNCMRYFKESEAIRFSDFKDFANHWSEPMQYTGLKDKNGKEIYAGDIISANGMFNDFIVFEDGGFNLNGGESTENLLYQLEYYGNVEVIGNI